MQFPMVSSLLERLGPDDGRVQKVYRNHGQNTWGKLAPHSKERRTKSPTELKAFGAASAFLGRIRGQIGRQQAVAGGRWWWKRKRKPVGHSMLKCCLER